MDLKALVKNLSPEAYERLLCAAETGRWPDGTQVDQKQREHAVQACMLYRSLHATDEELFVVNAQNGQLVTGVEAKKQYHQDSNAIPTRNLN